MKISFTNSLISTTFLVLIILPILTIAQYGRNNIWYFGENAGIDFSYGSPVALSNSAMVAVEGCATICDVNGNLLMYTNGQEVWNKNHQIMQNGSGLNGSHSATQSGLFIPDPAQNNRCYLFTIDYEGNPKGLQYSIIDLSLQNGLGEVITKNVPLLSPTTEIITSTTHTNDSEVWFVVHEF